MAQLSLPQDTLFRPRRALENTVSVQGIRSPILRGVVFIAPWMILAIVVLYGGFLGDPMFGSGLVAAALALFTFQLVMQRIPETFGTLWSRNLIARKPDAIELASAPASVNSAAVLGDEQSVTQPYDAFIKDVERWLNHRWSWGLGILFAILGFARFPYQSGGLNEFWRQLLRDLPRLSWTDWVDIVGEPFIGFIIGLLVWRMIVAAVKVRELGKRFDLNVQLGHPDGCGGLEPLGNLCLWNALLVTIPGVFLGAWIILGPRSQYGNLYVELHSKLLLVPIILAPLTFILPLWSVHQVMASKAAEVRLELDRLSQSIDHLARELLNRADELQPEEGEKIAKNLELRQQIYRRSQQIPLWPLNVGLLAKFATSQVVPVLGLTGLGQPLLKVVDAFVQALGKLQ